jgi:hypothetical protein
MEVTMKKVHSEIRAHVSYDIRDNSDLMVGLDGEWYLGIRCLDGWQDVRNVSCWLHTLNPRRVDVMHQCGQVDNHIKAFEARRDFRNCAEEIAREVNWQLRQCNYGNAKSLQALADRCRPLIDEVWTDEWQEAQEMMGECLARMEP